MQYLCTFNTLPHISFMNYFAPKGEWTHFRRQNGEYILYYLVDGAMHLREGEKEYSLKAGDVFLLQPGLVHEGTKPAGCAYYFVHFSNICILPFERETVPLEGDADFFQTYEEGGEGQYDME
ncbi:MAG: AraC family ligand binding domain-containing protein, partial [Oscillospiraceae bacterium]|nr:AraC family ligand binding domain-containing protein [Oscillospiraceae bacterium]